MSNKKKKVPPLPVTGIPEKLEELPCTQKELELAGVVPALETEPEQVADKKVKSPEEISGMVVPPSDAVPQSQHLPEVDPRPEDIPAATGGIYEPLVFKLSMYEERINRCKSQIIQVQLAISEQIRALEVQRNSHIMNLTRELRTSDSAYRQLQEDIEEKHKIRLREYAYDDEMGMLNKIVEPVEVPPAPVDVKPN